MRRKTIKLLQENLGEVLQGIRMRKEKQRN
jgi:hypothetical protein